MAEEPTPILAFKNNRISQTSDWTSLRASKDLEGEEAKEAELAAKESKSRLEEHIRGLFTNYNVVVLAGSGASLNAVSKDKGGPKMSDLWNAVSEWEEFSKITELVKLGESQNIELLLSQCHNAVAFLGEADKTSVEAFIKKAEGEIYKQCTEFLEDTSSLPQHEKLLERLTKRKSKFPRPKIFTTNYDRCFEFAAARKGLTVIDGFSFSQPRTFDPNYFGYDIVRRAQSSSESNELVDGVIQLLKIHGSVDWAISNNGISQVAKPDKNKRCLIYPASTKYQHSYTQPYLELMARFLMALREPNTALITIGFGFNDDHLTAPILSAVRSNPSLNMLVVDPFSKAKTVGPKLAEVWKELDAATGAKVTLLNADFGQFVDLIPDLKALGHNENSMLPTHPQTTL
jgi:hypothetical protein